MTPTQILALLRKPGIPRVVTLVAAAAVLLALVLWLASPRGGGTSTAYHEVRRGTFTVSIVEPGTLNAVSEVSIRCNVDGTARVIYIVPEGTYVKKGDLLVELDSAQAEDQVNQQLINFEKAQFALIQSQEQLAIQKSTADSDVRNAELNLTFAKMDLEKFDKGEASVSQIEASNKLVQAASQLSVALETFNWTTNLAAKGFETKQRVDSDRLSVLNNQNSLIVASNTIWMLNEFDIPKQRAQFVSAVQEASNQLQRVIAQSKARLAQAEADLLTQSNTLILNQRKLERDRKNLEATRIEAPQDGLVVYAVGEGRFSSESLVEEGAVVRNRQELIKLPDTSRMKVTVRVHESHVNMVQRGLPAFVTLDSMPDIRFAAVVERVALLPDTQSRWGNPNLKVYNTDVVITDPLPDIKPGVSAKAEIIITNIPDTLSVPIQAVTTHRGRQVVYSLAGGDPAPQPVEVGLYNTKFIQIVSGVREGDRVLLAPPFDTHEKDIEGEVLTAEEKAQVSFTNAPAPPTPRRTPPADATPDSSTSLNRAEPAVAARAAAEPDGESNGESPARRANAGGFDREAMLKQYDKDGDGQLSDEEREAMRAAFANRPGGPRGGFNMQEMIRQFDKDGDGQLSDEEREAMRAARGGRSGGPGRGNTQERPGGTRDQDPRPGGNERQPRDAGSGSSGSGSAGGTAP